jgi:bacterioferritin
MQHTFKPIEELNNNKRKELLMSEENLMPGGNADLVAQYVSKEDLIQALKEETQDELGHAAFLTDVIIDLGGEPTTLPKEFAKAEGLKNMLELDLEMERHDVENYIKHAQMAGDLGLVELQMKVEEMAADEAGHARELRRILKGM